MKIKSIIFILSVFFIISCTDDGYMGRVTNVTAHLKENVRVYQGDNFNKFKDSIYLIISYSTGKTEIYHPLKWFLESEEGSKDLDNVKGFYTDKLGKKTATIIYDTYNYDVEYYSATLDFEVLPAEFAFHNGELMSYNGTNPDVVIPSTINGQAVTKIGYGAFKNKNISSVTIPSTVTSIRPYAFAYNKNFKTLVLPSQLPKIQEYSFYASGLETIVIPNSVKTIGKRAFQLNKLSNVILSNSLSLISAQAFSNNNITSLIFPNSLRTIEENAFERNSLTDITIPQGVTAIKDEAFLNNPIEKVSLPNSLNELGLLSFYTSPNSPKIKEVTIPTKFQSSISDYFYSLPEIINYLD